MIKRHMEFSAWYRITHWVRFFSFIVLILTGFCIGVPFIVESFSSEPTNFLLAEIRAWHEIFGFLLIAVTIGKVYLFFVDKKSKCERVSFLDFINPKVWINQIKYYLLVGKHPHLRGAYNPLQFIAYLGVYIALLVLCVTGLILYSHVYHEGLGGFMFETLRPLEAALGGLGDVRVIHRIAMWFFIIFVPIHVYLATFNAIYGKEGGMDAIVTGYKWEEEK